MDNLIFVVAVLIIIYIVLHRVNKRNDASKSSILIDTYVFPESIKHRVIEKYPHLSENLADEVIEGLREYFHICNLAGKDMVSMPSQAVDVAWHEFILFTREYDYFCNKALGRFLHHIPAEAMQSKTVAQKGIKRVWELSCIRENIQIRNPNKLPMLFVIDTQLNIPDGLKYTLDCESDKNNVYCASHISGDSGSDSSDGGCSGGSGCGGV